MTEGGQPRVESAGSIGMQVTFSSRAEESMEILRDWRDERRRVKGDCWG